MRNIIIFALLGLLFLGATTQTGPPMPPGMGGYVSKPKFTSPKGTEFTASLGSQMVSVPSLFIPANEFLITNILVTSGVVDLFWNSNRSGPYRVWGSPEPSGPWAAVSDPTILLNHSFPSFENHYWRVQAEIPLLFLNTNSQPRLTWAVPEIDMADSLQTFLVQRRGDAPPAGQPISNDDGWTDQATLVSTARDYQDTAPGPLWYRLKQTTVNGVVIPYPVQQLYGSQAVPGTLEWARAIIGTVSGNSKNINVRSCCVDPSTGDIIICGSYSQNLLASSTPKVDFGGGTTLPYNCLSESIALFVARYTRNNSLVWVKGVTTGTGLSQGSSVVVNSSGDIFVTGFFTLSMTINGTTLNAASASPDGFLIKFNSSGVIQNTQVIGSATTDYGISLNLDASGNPVLVGNFSGTATFDPTHELTASGGLDLFIAVYNKTDLTISILKGYGAAGDETVSSAWYEPTGPAAGIYISGYLVGTGNFGGGNVTAQSGNYDMFIVKYDLSGNWVWNVRAGLAGTSGAQGRGVTVDPTGRVLLTGFFTGTDSSSGQTGPSNVDFGNGVMINGPQFGSATFIAQYTTAGVCQWVKRYGGTSGGSDSCRSLVTDSSGNIYVVGNTVTSAYDNFFIIAPTPKFLVFKMSPATLSGSTWTPGTVQWIKTFVGDTGQTCEAWNITRNATENKLHVVGFINGGTDMGAPVNGGGNSYGALFFPQNGILIRMNP